MIKQFYIFVITLIVLSLPNFGMAQEYEYKVGSWRTHGSYQNADLLAVSDAFVLAGSSSGIFAVDKSNNQINILSKNEGLTSVNPVYLDYNATANKFFVCYEDGLIDLIEDQQISTVRDIFRANIATSKRVNHILSIGKYSYLSTDFGVVVFDAVKEEIKETYRDLQAGITFTSVKSSAINEAKDSIYIIVDDKVLYASMASSVNRLDNNSWSEFNSSNGLPGADLKSIVAFNDTVYVASDTAVYVLQNGTWQNVFSELNGLSINSFDVKYGNFIIHAGTKPYKVISSSIKEQINVPNVQNANRFIVDEDNKTYAALRNFALISDFWGWSNIYLPNGLERNTCQKLYAANNTMIQLAGGFSLSSFVNEFNPSSFSIYKDGLWDNYFAANKSSLGMPALNDVSAIAYNSAEKTYYYSNIGTGIVAYDLTKDTMVFYNDTISFPSYGGTTSSFIPMNPFFANTSDFRISDIAVDEAYNTWFTSIVSSSNVSSLFWKDVNDNWYSKTFNNTVGQQPVGIRIDSDQNKWMYSKNGVVVFNQNESAIQTDDQLQFLGVSNGFPVKQVNALEFDQDGEVWIGTDEGIAVIYNTRNLYQGTALQATTPIFEGRPLLTDEKITCIEVDGGNNKWIGTNNGLWWFDESAEEVLSFYNIDNSPLPSNEIRDIEILPHTGEVFIATSEGLVSFKGFATDAGDTHSETATIFPNPVKPEFQGYVTIDGLATDATVKITDVAGRLVYEQDSKGGRAVWNGLDINGNKAQTGVYLVYSATKDGQNTLVGKIAFIE